MMTARNAVPLLAGLALVLYRVIRKSPTSGEKLGTALGLAAGVCPAAWVMAARAVPSKLVVGYAVLFFAGSVLLKWAVYRAIFSKYFHPRVSPAAGGIAQGILSATCELGAASIAFGLWLPGLDPWQVFGFGAGAAAAEAVIVTTMQNPLAGESGGDHVARELAHMRAGPQWFQALVPLVERCLATVDHIACRSLVAAGIGSGRVWPIAAAFVVFAATDGYTQYCLARRLAFAQPAVASKFYGLLSLAAGGASAGWAVALTTAP
jgi:hypothetical protein